MSNTVQEILQANASIKALAREHVDEEPTTGGQAAARQHGLDFDGIAAAAGLLACDTPAAPATDGEATYFAAGVVVGVLIGMQIAHERRST